MIDHPLRRQVVAEMHLRPPLLLAVPSRLYQIVRLVDRAEVARERDHAASILADGAAPAAEVRFLAADPTPAVSIAWEQHSEGSTASVALGAEVAPEAERAALGWLNGFPGQTIRATCVEIHADEAEAVVALGKRGAEATELVGGRARGVAFWSDFRLREDEEYGSVLVAANQAHPAELARVVQQLQELGNYRNLALMGLAVVRGEAAALSAVEARLRAATEAVRGGGQDAALLETLVDLAADCAALRAATGYRLGATLAYGRIVEDRLRSLNPEPVEGLQTLGEFTERRLLPALRTCADFKRRLEEAAQGVAQAMSMLRTRIDLNLERQNMALLQSMERSAARQLKLQHLVEGLSVIALTYYAISLLAKLLEGAKGATGLHFDDHAVIALSILPVMATLALLLRWRSRHSDDGEGNHG